MRFKKARKVMRKALNNDEGLRLGYQANIAMLIYDNQTARATDQPRVNLKTKDGCGDIAERLINLIFS